MHLENKDKLYSLFTNSDEYIPDISSSLSDPQSSLQPQDHTKGLISITKLANFGQSGLTRDH